MLNQDIIQCSELLIDKQLTIAFAESASAGRMAAEFSMVPNAGKFLKGGLVCYDASLKEEILKVPKSLIDEFTPESVEVTKALAFQLKKLIPADLHVAITGLPAPGGSENSEKPVGTMFIAAVYRGEELFMEKKIFNGEPEEIILHSIYFTAQMLVNKLTGNL
jgi:nicotinamide-nucleotide amidase